MRVTDLQDYHGREVGELVGISMIYILYTTISAFNAGINATSDLIHVPSMLQCALVIQTLVIG